MKKVFILCLVLLVTVSALTGCGGTTSKTTDGDAASVKEEKVTLQFMVNFQATEKITETFEQVIEEFEGANPNIDIELIPGNAEYEAIMKTKMAANELPDLWTTHGWSVARYSEYLLPLTDQSWVKELNPSIENVITDKNGDVYVLPVDVDLSGIAYNKTVVEESGVNVHEIKTWADFVGACKEVKAAGYTPIHIGGKDHWTVGNFFDWAAPSFLITNEAANDRIALKDGSFDWRKWEQVAELLVKLNENELLNKDKLSSGYIDSAKNLAQGKVAFEFYGNYAVAEALKYNPNANLGFMPVPSNDPSDEPTLISGERTTVGIWKDSTHKKEAITFISYLTKPEIMSKLASANGLPAGLKEVDSDTGLLKGDYQKYSKLRGFPYFDREYLPSGMWDTMCSTGTGLLTGDVSVREAGEQMKKEYDRLR